MEREEIHPVVKVAILALALLDAYKLGYYSGRRIGQWEGLTRATEGYNTTFRNMAKIATIKTAKGRGI